ncbi:helix-turn-helix domain-containing protein [Sphingomonas sp. MMS12-HWE2-04]|uniref:helix-turn-helix domain-containing protein n=1 Tax=Sphingomonas sp. MMS12-HWE2-04 TaxID=3234199 RepID=UPI00384F8A18
MAALPLDRYVIDVLMPDLVGHDRKPSAYLVYLLIEALEGDRAPLGYASIAERTGLSRRTCQDAIAHLERRGLIAVERRADNEAARFRPLRPWIRRH